MHERKMTVERKMDGERGRVDYCEACRKCPVSEKEREERKRREERGGKDSDRWPAVA